MRFPLSLPVSVISVLSPIIGTVKLPETMTNQQPKTVDVVFGFDVATDGFFIDIGNHRMHTNPKTAGSHVNIDLFCTILESICPLARSRVDHALLGEFTFNANFAAATDYAVEPDSREYDGYEAERRAEQGPTSSYAPVPQCGNIPNCDWCPSRMSCIDN
jgi:hypothetical protein